MLYRNTEMKLVAREQLSINEKNSFLPYLTHNTFIIKSLKIPLYDCVHIMN